MGKYARKGALHKTCPILLQLGKDFRREMTVKVKVDRSKVSGGVCPEP